MKSIHISSRLTLTMHTRPLCPLYFHLEPEFRLLMTNILLHQKRTAPGPDEFPYWLWRDYTDFLAPLLTNIFNNSLRH